MSSGRRSHVKPVEEDPTSGASGIPESLYGRINPKEMGSRAIREAAPVIRQKTSWTGASAIVGVGGKRRVLEVSDGLHGLKYRPKTTETRRAFEFLCGAISGLLGGDLPHDVILSATDETLGLLKEADVKDLDKKVRIASTLGSVSLDSDTFMRLVNLGKLITDYDYVQASEGVVDDDEAETGVAVVFEEEEDDEVDQDGVQFAEVVESDGEQAGFELVKGSESIEDDIFIVTDQQQY